MEQSTLDNIRKELRDLENVARKIESDNIRLAQRHEKMAFDNKVLIEEKNLLVTELLSKDKTIQQLRKRLSLSKSAQEDIAISSEDLKLFPNEKIEMSRDPTKKEPTIRKAKWVKSPSGEISSMFNQEGSTLLHSRKFDLTQETYSNYTQRLNSKPPSSFSRRASRITSNAAAVENTELITCPKCHS